MDSRVGRIVKLLQNIAVGRVGQDLVSLGDGPFHAVGTRRQHDLGAKRPQQNAPLQAHCFRHREDDLVALDGGDEGEGDAGVAAGGLDQDGFAGLDLALLLRVVDHCQANAVLYARQRILTFQLHNYGSGQPGGHAVQTHERGMSNQFSHIRGNTRHDDLLVRDCPRHALDELGVAVELSGGENARESGRTPGIGALTRAVSATSTHAHRVDPAWRMWQAADVRMQWSWTGGRAPRSAGRGLPCSDPGHIEKGAVAFQSHLTTGPTQVRPENPSPTRNSAPGPETSKVAIFCGPLVLWVCPATVTTLLIR